MLSGIGDRFEWQRSFCLNHCRSLLLTRNCAGASGILITRWNPPHIKDLRLPALTISGMHSEEPSKKLRLNLVRSIVGSFGINALNDAYYTIRWLALVTIGPHIQWGESTLESAMANAKRQQAPWRPRRWSI